MQHKNLSFDDVNNALQNVNAMTETAEVHGTLCGMACINGTSCIDNWLAIALEDQDSSNLHLKDTRSILIELYQNTYEKLNSSSYNLEILIHSDDSSLDIRVDDLSLWCQGFLYGLSVAGLDDINKLPTEAAEILQDMSDISKVGYSQDDGDEENEAAFVEIIEYIRMGTYVIFNAFNNDASTQPNTIH